MQPRLWAYLASIGEKQGVLVRIVGGFSDHAHVLLQLPSNLPLADVISLLKSNSSKWMNDQGQSFAWQEGYAAFSVSSSNLEAVTKYIRNQETHHRKITFEHEFLSLLRKHHVPFDPEFVFG